MNFRIILFIRLDIQSKFQQNIIFFSPRIELFCKKTYFCDHGLIVIYMIDGFGVSMKNLYNVTKLS